VHNMCIVSSAQRSLWLGGAAAAAAAAAPAAAAVALLRAVIRQHPELLVTPQQGSTLIWIPSATSHRPACARASQLHAARPAARAPPRRASRSISVQRHRRPRCSNSRSSRQSGLSQKMQQQISWMGARLAAQSRMAMGGSHPSGARSALTPANSARPHMFAHNSAVMSEHVFACSQAFAAAQAA
jgi:hypothetical protein